MKFVSTERGEWGNAAARNSKLRSMICLARRIWDCSYLLRLPSSTSGGAFVFWLARTQGSASLKTSACAAAATFCVIGAGFSLNDATDYREDRINNPSRPIARGSLPVASGVSSYLCFAGLSLLFGALTKFPDTFLIAFSMLAAYSLYSLFFKRVWFLKNVSVALTIAMVPLMASSCAHVPFAGTNWLLVLALFLWSLEKEIMMDVRDMEGDRRVGLVTVPILLGRRPTGVILTVVNLAVWVSGLWLMIVAHLFSNLGWPVFFAIFHTGLIFYLGAKAPNLWIKLYLRLQIALVVTVLGSLIL